MHEELFTRDSLKFAHKIKGGISCGIVDEEDAIKMNNTSASHPFTLDDQEFVELECFLTLLYS